MARAELKTEVLSSNTMWYCLSCYLCTVRCPRDIKITKLMHVFEGMAANTGSSNKRTTTPVIYKGFNAFIYNRGRISELWLMMGYYVRTNPLKALKMIFVAWDLLTHNRLAIRMDKMSMEGIRQLQAIISKAEPRGGAR